MWSYIQGVNVRRVFLKTGQAHLLSCFRSSLFQDTEGVSDGFRLSKTNMIFCREQECTAHLNQLSNRTKNAFSQKSFYVISWSDGFCQLYISELNEHSSHASTFGSPPLSSTEALGLVIALSLLHSHFPPNFNPLKT